MGILTKTCKGKDCGSELLSSADFCDRSSEHATPRGSYKKFKEAYLLPLLQ